MRQRFRGVCGLAFIILLPIRMSLLVLRTVRTGSRLSKEPTKAQYLDNDGGTILVGSKDKVTSIKVTAKISRLE